MIPGSNIFGHERALVLRVSFAACIIGTVCLPLFGLVTCVFISSAFHFDDSTGTHCQVSFILILPHLSLTNLEIYMHKKRKGKNNKNCVCVQVPNYLPSISASISLSPESHIWRFCIGLHSAPRLLVAFSYFSLYNARFDSKFPESLLTCLNLAFSMCENLGLLLLTYVSSSETYCE